MKKNTFETRYKDFLERSFNQQNSDIIKRYILMIALMVYVYQFYYFEYFGWKPLSESFGFYLALLLIYIVAIKGKTSREKIVLREEGIWVVTEGNSSLIKTIHGKRKQKETVDGEKITFSQIKKVSQMKQYVSQEKGINKIPFDKIQSLSIIRDGIFLGKGMAVSYGSKSLKSDAVETSLYFYLDANEIINLEYFIQRNKKYKDLVEKNNKAKTS